VKQPRVLSYRYMDESLDEKAEMGFRDEETDTCCGEEME
jgi:hypothetical protein